jgi:RNA polymerase sigma factor (sigma-70 family)
VSTLLGTTQGVQQDLPPRERTRVLYERHGQRVFSFCLSRLRNREEAQDATQTTFLYAMRSLERGVVPEFELAWLLKIAFNACRAARRASSNRLVPIGDATEFDDPVAEEVADNQERLNALRESVAALPETQRRAILLREWQGLSYADIADELNLSVGAVETLLFRARRRLTKGLEQTRERSAGFDLASPALLLRSLLPSTGAKVAAATTAAGLTLAIAPALVQEIRTSETPPARAKITIASPEATRIVAKPRRSVRRAQPLGRPTRRAATPALARRSPGARGVVGERAISPTPPVSPPTPPPPAAASPVTPAVGSAQPPAPPAPVSSLPVVETVEQIAAQAPQPQLPALPSVPDLPVGK